MAINGKTFLRLNKRNQLKCTNHARQRLLQHTKAKLCERDIAKLFMAARQIKPEQMFLLGFRPNYYGRLARNRPSWYFHAQWDGWEIIFVIGQDRHTEEPVWVTTYGRNSQNDMYAVLEYDQLASVA